MATRSAKRPFEVPFENGLYIKIPRSPRTFDARQIYKRRASIAFRERGIWKSPPVRLYPFAIRQRLYGQFRRVGAAVRALFCPNCFNGRPVC